MKSVRIRPSVLAIAFYLILMAIWVFAVSDGGKDYWYTGLAPWYGLGLVFLIARTRYKVDKNTLVVRNPFEKRVIKLDSIQQIEEISNPVWKRMLTGFPAYSIRLTHAEQRTLVHANRPETLKAMLSGVKIAA